MTLWSKTLQKIVRHANTLIRECFAFSTHPCVFFAATALVVKARKHCTQCNPTRLRQRLRALQNTVERTGKWERHWSQLPLLGYRLKQECWKDEFHRNSQHSRESGKDVALNFVSVRKAGKILHTVQSRSGNSTHCAIPLGYRLGQESGKDIAHCAIPLLTSCELDDGELICLDENFEQDAKNLFFYSFGSPCNVRAQLE